MDRLTSHLSKPNTRIPPILVARQISTDRGPPEQFTHLASISKHKLYHEASTDDPDLRRCLGHHSLLRRSIQEAKADMKRYFDDVLNNDSDSDSDSDSDEDFEVGEAELIRQWPRSQPAEFTFPQQQKRVQPPPAPPLPPMEDHVPGSRPNWNSTPVCVKERILGAMKGLVKRRHTAPSRIPSRSPATAVTSVGVDEKGSGSLIHVAEKNLSCTEIPVHTRIHEDVVEHVKEGLIGLRRSQSQTQIATPTKSFTMRGRQYAQRLGLKVAPSVSVAM